MLGVVLDKTVTQCGLISNQICLGAAASDNASHRQSLVARKYLQDHPYTLAYRTSFLTLFRWYEEAERLVGFARENGAINNDDARKLADFITKRRRDSTRRRSWLRRRVRETFGSERGRTRGNAASVIQSTDQIELMIQGSNDDEAQHQASEPSRHDFGDDQTPVDMKEAHMLFESGRIALANGNLPEAEAIDQQVLVILEKAYGKNDQRLLHVMNRLTFVYQRQNKIPELLKMYKRRLAIYEAKYGPKHKYTLWGVWDIGQFYVINGPLDLAEQYPFRVLVGFEEIYGKDAERTLEVARNLRDIYTRRGKLQEAQEMEKRLKWQ